jgi:hypothetical protein
MGILEQGMREEWLEQSSSSLGEEGLVQAKERRSVRARLDIWAVGGLLEGQHMAAVVAVVVLGDEAAAVVAAGHMFVVIY